MGFEKERWVRVWGESNESFGWGCSRYLNDLRHREHILSNWSFAAHGGQGELRLWNHGFGMRVCEYEKEGLIVGVVVPALGAYEGVEDVGNYSLSRLQLGIKCQIPFQLRIEPGQHEYHH